MTDQTAGLRLLTKPRFAKRYTGGHWAPPPRREAANDNHPPVVDHLAKRREYVSSLPEWDGRTVKAWPTGTRLLRARRFEDLTILEHWRDAMDIPRIIAANDNTPDLDENGDPVPPSVDTNSEIVPTVEVMRECADRGSCERHPRSRRIEAAPKGQVVVTRFSTVPAEAVIRLGDLRFDRLGRLIGFRNSSRKWCLPSERYTDAKGCADLEVDPESGIRLSRAELALSPEEEIIRQIDGERLRTRLGEFTAMVLDRACTAETACEIAVSMQGREEGKVAERAGVRLIDSAIEDYRKILSEDRPSLAA